MEIFNKIVSLSVYDTPQNGDLHSVLYTIEWQLRVVSYTTELHE